MSKELWGGALPRKPRVLGPLCHLEQSPQGPGWRAAWHEGALPLLVPRPATPPQARGLYELPAQGHSSPLTGPCLPRVQGHCQVPSPTSGLGQANFFLWSRVKSYSGPPQGASHPESSLSKYIYISISRYTFIICIFFQHSSSFMICLF